jgi:hypothetical protein
MNPGLPRTDLLPAGVPTLLILLMTLAAVGLWLLVRRITRRDRTRLPRHVVVALRMVLAAMAAWCAIQLLGRTVVFGCNWPVWGAAAVLGFAVEGMAAAYDHERRLAGRTAGPILVVLRALALIIVALIILQPTLIRTVTRRIERCVALLLDDSDSMRFDDTSWNTSERLALARQFGLLKTRELKLPALEPLTTLPPRLRPWAAAELADTRAPAALRELLDEGERHARALDGQLNDDPFEKTTNAPLLTLQRHVRNTLLPAFAEAQAARRSRRLDQAMLLRLQDALDMVATLAPDARQAADEQVWLALDEARRAAVDAACTTNRATVAGRLLLEPLPDERHSLLAALARRYDIRTYRLGRGLQPLPLAADATPDVLATNLPALPDDDVQQAFRSATDYATALEQVMQEIPSEKLAGVLMLTDGRHNGDTALEPVARRLGAQEVPVSTLLVGSTEAPLDLALADIVAPESVYLGDKVRLRTQFTATGAAGRQARIRLLHDGEKVDETLVTIATADEQREIRLSHLPGTNGLARYTVEAELLEGERFPSNNVWHVDVAISDDRTHVLLLDDYPRWDFRYLRNLFHGRDKSVHLQYVLQHPDRIADINPTNTLPAASASRPFGESEAGALPESREAWREFDAIILGDLDDTVLTPEVAGIIRECVADRGALLVITAGPRAMPHAFAPDSPLAEMLPFHITPRAEPEAFWTPPESAFRVVLTPAGLNHPVMQQSASPTENESIWQKLPPFTWRLPLKAVKPGAEVLAYARPEDEAPAVTTATTLLNAVEQMRAEKLRQEQHALVVVQPFGRGKVVALATDQSWRLRYRVGDTLHHRFWGQIIRWGLGERLRDGTPQLRVGTDRIVYAPNEPIRLVARVLDEEFAAVNNARLMATLQQTTEGATGEIARLTLEYRPDSQGLYEVALPPRAEAGHYQVTVERLDAARGATAPVTTRFRVVTSRRPVEMARVNATREFADGLARWSGGRVAGPAEAAALAEAFGEGSRTVREPLEIPLWDRPWLYLLLVALVMSEWILRKTRGLA